MPMDTDELSLICVHRFSSVAHFSLCSFIVFSVSSVANCLLCDSAADRRLRQSIGQLINRTQSIFFTAVLQKDGLPDASSVTVKQLDPPALHCSLPWRRFDEPAGGGGVDRRG